MEERNSITADAPTFSLIFFVNGKKVVESNPNPEWTLLYYLRNKLRLCGTKLGCAEGGCGACTVMVSKYDRKANQLTHLAVNACLSPVCAMHGLAVTTVEGIGSTKTRLHPVQERIARAHGSQCGFCTPGIVMSMYSLLRTHPVPSMADMEVAFQGNLCRCTGYRPIIEGYKTFTKEFSTNGVCGMGDKCCRKGAQNGLSNGASDGVLNGVSNGASDGVLNGVSNGVSNGFTDGITNGVLNGLSKGVTNGCSDDSETLYKQSEFTPLDATQEPIFPPELKLSSKLDAQSLIFRGSKVIWYRPVTLTEILQIKHDHSDAKIIVGNTEVGVEVKFKQCFYPVLVFPNKVPELTSIVDKHNKLIVGASVTLWDLEQTLQKEIDTKPEHETRIFLAIVQMLKYFAGRQIRNVASIGGNIMTGSPISDLNPIFTAGGLALEVQSLKRGKRIVYMGEGFFTGYRKNIIAPDEVLISIEIPRTNKDQHFLAFKQAKRRDDDIAIVNAAFDVTFKENTDVIEKIKMAFGGMAPTTVLAPRTQELVIGKRWTAEMLEPIYTALAEDLPLAADAPGGTILYRKSLTLSLFFKAYLNISQRLQSVVPGRVPIPQEYKSGADVFKSHIPKSTQMFEMPAEGQFKFDRVGKPVVHLSAYKQATGEAVYCDDIPRFENELYLALVLSTKAHANITSIDAREALSMPGVHAFYSAKDLTDDQNKVGAILNDEAVFIKKTVTSQGQVLGAIVADDQATAQRAARKVNVHYEDIQPVIITIEDAIKHKNYFEGYPKQIIKGDIQKPFRDAAHIISGVCRMGGQEHFYLETCATIAVPKGEDGEIELFGSFQHPTEIQEHVGTALGIPCNRIVARVKRLGGGFGGKESRPMLVAVPVAIAASRLGRPVRCMLDRDEDMMITGTRHPFLFKYKVSCTSEGLITGCDIEMYNNAGYSMDLSCSVMERAMLHFENSYLIPNVRVQGWVCRTNLPSNTAFRGFGGPQGMFVAEHIIRDIARVLNKDPADISRLNLYVEGNLTHYNQILSHCTIRRCWDECMRSSEFSKRRDDIKLFNRQHRWRKRGISVVPTKFGVAFGSAFLNQAGALVHVYRDGSVLLSHGGTEMGQGLHTKMIQVASRALEIPMENIHISETSTDKVPNTSATAASVSSDLNGMAILNACQQISDRLIPYKKQNPIGKWNAWVAQAYMDRVSLSATGFYATPNLGHDFDTNTDNPYNYFTYGVGVSEVEIDCLTGDHQVLRTDIVMDLGSSLNPAIDIGQVEGGFMQGYGLFTLEELIYSPQGTLMSRGPGVYKLPGFSDIPVEFNVSLLKGAPNPRAVYSSKAVGEPPLFLASSAFFAIKEAISAARQDAGLSAHFYLESPATSARIRMACQDNITQIFPVPEPGSFTPWNITP